MSQRIPSNLKEQEGNIPPCLWQVFFKIVIPKVFRCCVYFSCSIRLPCSIYPERFGKHAREAWLLLLVSCSTKIYLLSVEWCKTTNCPGRDAKRLVILKGDFESGEEKGGGQMKEEIARKYSAYFQSILHHNNGYFLTVSASLSNSEAMQWKTKAQRIDCSSSKWISPPRQIIRLCTKSQLGVLHLPRALVYSWWYNCSTFLNCNDTEASKREG